MPVKVLKDIPAIGFLQEENIFIMTEERALSQEIRPLKIAILNLMPNKIMTETQLLRLIANTPLQVEAVFLHPKSHVSKNTDEKHIECFYKTLDEVIKSKQKFDAMIVTGAPVEMMEFSKVDYWDELKEIMAWAEHNVFSTMYICWAAQAAIFHLYGINKEIKDKKIFGIFEHDVLDKKNPLLRGFDETFLAPHSRFTEVDAEALYDEPSIDVLAVAKEGGLYLAASKDLRKVFVFGHGEYDRDSLHNEFIRDFNKGLNPDKPKNYYVDGEVGRLPNINWRAHHSLLFMNWLNYCVYQNTPYDIEKIG